MLEWMTTIWGVALYNGEVVIVITNAGIVAAVSAVVVAVAIPMAWGLMHRG